MKKALLILLTLCLMLSFSGTAHADQTYKNPVYELYSADGCYEDGVGNRETYSYHVPQINADTSDAEEINAEISEMFGSRVEAQFESMENGTSLWSRRTEWESFWNGDQLFLLVTADTTGDIKDYAAYGYDFETGSRVANKEILDQKGISEEEYLEKLREKVRSIFEETFQLPEGTDTGINRKEVLDKLLNSLSMEQPMFVDQSGEIAAIVRIDTVAGAGYNNYIVTPFSP